MKTKPDINLLLDIVESYIGSGTPAEWTAAFARAAHCGKVSVGTLEAAYDRRYLGWASQHGYDN